MVRMHPWKSVAGALVLVVGAGVVGLSVGPVGPVAIAQGTAPSGSYEVDNTHSSVIFKLMHADLAPFMGRFNKVSGTMHVDPQNTGSSFLDISIDMASVDTNNSGRDDHARSADYLNVKQFPTATFKSKRMDSGSEKKLLALGDFTAFGVTKEIAVPIELTGKGTMRGQEKIGIFATFKFKRSDFGVDARGLGDEVEMLVALEAAKQ